MQKKLQNVERLRLPVDAEITVEGKPQRLVSFAAFAQLQGGAGFVLIDLQNEGRAHYGHAVSVLPYSERQVLPLAARLPERDSRSAAGDADAADDDLGRADSSRGAAEHLRHASPDAGRRGDAAGIRYQASVGEQGHQNFESRFHQLSGAAGGGVSEVVAESWPGQNMIDSCIDCVRQLAALVGPLAGRVAAGTGRSATTSAAAATASGTARGFLPTDYVLNVPADDESSHSRCRN